MTIIEIDSEEYVPQDSKRAEILQEFTFWLEDYIREQQTHEFHIQSKLDTLMEVRDKLNQIRERIF